MNPVVLRFTLLGPVVGSVGFNVMDAALTSHPVSGGVRSGFGFLLTGLLKGVLGLFLAYPVGLPPAFLAAALLWHILKEHPESAESPLRRAALGTALGLICAVPYGGLISGVWLGKLPLCWAAAGATSGLICAAVVGRGSFRQARNIAVT